MKQIDIRGRLKQIAKEREEIIVAINYLDAEKLKLQEVCSHNKTTRKSHYYSGSYTDHACTYYKDYCDYCGKLVKEFTKEHSYFG